MREQKKKELERATRQLEQDYKFLKQDLISYQKVSTKKQEIQMLEKEMEQLNKYYHSGVEKVLHLLKEEGFIEDETTLSLKGKIAAQLRETHCLVFANIFINNQLDHLNAIQLVALFSCFTNISVQEDYKTLYPKSHDKDVEKIVKLV